MMQSLVCCPQSEGGGIEVVNTFETTAHNVPACMPNVYAPGSGSVRRSTTVSVVEQVDYGGSSAMESFIEKRFQALTAHIDSWMRYHEGLVQSVQDGSGLKPSQSRGLQSSHQSDKLRAAPMNSAPGQSGDKASTFPQPLLQLPQDADAKTTPAVASESSPVANKDTKGQGRKRLSFNEEVLDLERNTSIGSLAAPADLSRLPVSSAAEGTSSTDSTETFTSEGSAYSSEGRLQVQEERDHRRQSLIDLETYRDAEAEMEQELRANAMSKCEQQIRTSINSDIEKQVERSCIERTVSSTWFSALFSSLIVLNSLWIGVEVEWHAMNGLSHTPQVFYVVDHTFAGLFLIELIFRFAQEGPSFLYSAEWNWNWLDIFIVVTSIIEFIVDCLSGFSQTEEDSGSGMGSTRNLRIIRVIRITRLLRVVRILRVVRFIQALRTLVQSILSTLRALFWAMILLSIIIYVFGVVFTQSATQHLDSCVGEYCPGAVKYWSTLPRSFFTLFKTVSGGVDWENAAYPLAQFSPYMVALFTVFIAFTYFAVLNVLTGFFVQSALDNASHDYDLVIQSFVASREMYTTKINNLFGDIDAQGHGEINIEELERYLETKQMKAYFTSLELECSDATSTTDQSGAWTLFKLLDIDNSGGIDRDEFREGCLHLKGPARQMELSKMQYENRLIRMKQNQFMNNMEQVLHLIVQHMGVPLPPDVKLNVMPKKKMASAPAKWQAQKSPEAEDENEDGPPM